MSDDGQLVIALDDIAALNCSIDEVGVLRANSKLDLVTDIAVLDSESVIEGSSVLSGCLGILTGNLEVVSEVLVGEGVFALQSDLLGDLGADVDAINRSPGAFGAAKDLGQDQVVDAVVSREGLGQLLSRKDAVSVGVKLTVRALMVAHSGRQLDKAVVVIAACDLGGD